MNTTAYPIWALCLVAAAQSYLSSAAWGVEQVQFTDSQDRPQAVEGEVLVEARDGGLLLLGDDGRIWTVQPDKIKKRASNEQLMGPVSHATIQKRLLDEMPAGFAVHKTKNYLICHNTNEQYVSWVGSLFEKLHRSFYVYWGNQDWDLQQPQFPLVGLVFADRKSFIKYARPELGDSVEGIIGYYNLETNRMTTFKMPNVERTVATIIHEAMHQLAYNAGLQQRFADNPMWVSEGLAVFFEAPDFSTPGGWRSIGRINKVNLQRFKEFALSRPADSLTTLIGDDKRFRDPESAMAAYSEAWALNYFLLKTRRKQYVCYLQQLSKGKPLEPRGPRDRVRMFEQAMGDDLATIESQFLPFINRLR